MNGSGRKLEIKSSGSKFAASLVLKVFSSGLAKSRLDDAESPQIWRGFPLTPSLNFDHHGNHSTIFKPMTEFFFS
jgi:hypothetical protein